MVAILHQSQPGANVHQDKQQLVLLVTSGLSDRKVSASLTHKHLEIHGCILNTVATDALVLKHQAISTHSAD